MNMYKVIENRYIGEDMYLMRVEGKFEGKMGQFYMLRAWDKFPLLSRPISIHDIDENSISFYDCNPDANVLMAAEIMLNFKLNVDYERI